MGEKLNMKIAFLTSEYPHSKLKRSAGIGTSIRNLAYGLVREGIQVTVFVAFQEKNESFMDGEIRIVSIGRKGYSFGGWYFERKNIQKKVQKEIDEQGIQLLEAPDWTGITAFMKFSVPIVIRIHGSDAYFCELEGRKQKLKNYFFEKTAIKAADHIISCSQFAADISSDIFNIKKEIKVIYNGIDVEKFKPDRSNVDPNRILYFGSIIRKKGVMELAEIFNHLAEMNENVKLILIGKDNQDILENKSTVDMFTSKLKEKHRSRVQYLPEVPYNEIREHLNRAAVVVLPSLAEAFPMTWLETLSLEIPLVSSNIGWANELMIDGETGYCCDPNNHSEYSVKIQELLKDEQLANSMGKQGRTRIQQNFALETIISENIDFYKFIFN